MASAYGLSKTKNIGTTSERHKISQIKNKWDKHSVLKKLCPSCKSCPKSETNNIGMDNRLIPSELLLFIPSFCQQMQTDVNIYARYIEPYFITNKANRSISIFLFVYYGYFF